MSSLHRKSLVATAAIFCCRFTGLLREMTYTALFGATGALDAFLTAFRLPNMLRDIFAEGALSQSFTSVMSKVKAKQGDEQAWTLAHRVISQLTALMVGIVAVGVLATGGLMQLLYPEELRVNITAGMSLPEEFGEEVQAVFQGVQTTADGQKAAAFSADKRLKGLEGTSCVRAKALERLQVGERVLLTTRRSITQKGVLYVSPQSFMGMAADLCRIMWPFILLASISALCMGVLNVFGIFGLPNLASAAFNLTTIGVGFLVGWWIDPHFGPQALYGFAVAVLCGGVAQILVQLPKLRRLGYRPHWELSLTWRGCLPHFSDERVRLVWRLMLPGMIAAGITQVNVFVNNIFALYLPGGSVTALTSAFHLWQLPVALFGVAIGMVVLPDVSRLSVTAGKQEISDRLAEALRFMAFFAVPSALILGLWGEQIVCLFYQRFRFDAQASELCGAALSAYSLGLLGYAGMKVLQPVFMALERPWAPAFLAVATCCISVGLNYLYVHVFGLGVQWLAFTTSCITTINFLFFFIYLHRLLGSMSLHVLVPGLLRIALASLVLGAFCCLMREFFFDGFTQWPFWWRLVVLATAGAGAGLIYLVAASVMRVPELRMFTTALVRRLRHRA